MQGLRLGSRDWRTGVAEWLRHVNVLSEQALLKWVKRWHFGLSAQAILTVGMSVVDMARKDRKYVHVCRLQGSCGCHFHTNLECNDKTGESDYANSKVTCPNLYVQQGQNK